MSDWLNISCQIFEQLRNFSEIMREISKLYAQGVASKGDIVEHVLDSDEELRSCDQGKAISVLGE